MLPRLVQNQDPRQICVLVFLHLLPCGSRCGRSCCGSILTCRHGKAFSELLSTAVRGMYSACKELKLPNAGPRCKKPHTHRQPRPPPLPPLLLCLNRPQLRLLPLLLQHHCLPLWPQQLPPPPLPPYLHEQDQATSIKNCHKEPLFCIEEFPSRM